jgi:hypothetical protein
LGEDLEASSVGAGEEVFLGGAGVETGAAAGFELLEDSPSSEESDELDDSALIGGMKTVA